MNNTKISIIIPCYNEESTIEQIIEKVLNVNIQKQIIIIDDYSSDNTKNIILKYKNNNMFKIILNDKNSGKGACIKSAKKFVDGDYVIIQDADLEYEPKDYYKIIDQYIKNKNVNTVYGSRLLNLSNNKFSSKGRVYINRILTLIFNLLYRQNITDAHTCYKSFKTELFKNINLVENGFNFCAEINCKVAKKGIKISEVPINYYGRTHKEGKKINFVDGIETIITYFKYLFKN